MLYTFLFWLLALPAFAQPPAPPNVVFILADDLRADALGCYGNRDVRTPVIDALARRGTRFTNAYIQGGDQGAVCAPSRAMLLSGKSFFRVSDKLDGVMTWPKLLRQRGYHTFITGKWHNEPKAVGQSFSEGKNVFLGGMADHEQIPLSDLKADGTFTEPVKQGFSTDRIGEAALAFLDRQTPGQPFVAYLPFTAPHDPRSPRPEYLARYGPVTLPPNFQPLHPFSFGGSMGGRDEFLAAFPRTPEVIRAQTAEYYALITHLDETIGKILQKLNDRGLAENTVVVFAADNGLALGSHGLLGKQNVYEHSTRVPLVVAGPGLPQGRTTDAFAYLLDLFPTLCHLTNTPVPADLDGQDVSDVIRGKTKTARPVIFTAYTETQRAVREGRWKLIRYPKIGRTALFDLQTDPYEQRNLAADPKQAARVKHLTEVLQTEQARYGDGLLLTATPLVSPDWDYRSLRRVPDKWQPKQVLDKYFTEK